MKKTKFSIWALLLFSASLQAEAQMCTYPVDACSGCPTVTMPVDATICPGGSFTYNFAPAVVIPTGMTLGSYGWTPPGTVTPPSGPPGPTTFTPPTTTTYTLNLTAYGPNMINNGNFESSPSTSCFASGYTFYPSGGSSLPSVTGYYAVGNDPQPYGPGTFVSMFDNTYGTAAGHMFIGKGSMSPTPFISTIVWTETQIPVCHDQMYEFTFWYANIDISVGNLALLQVYINGLPVGPTFTPGLPGVWNSGTVYWTAPTSALSLANIRIIDVSLEHNNNDFALDDITFRRYCKSTASFTVTVEEPMITGQSTTLCENATLPLTGTPAGGSWASSNITVATVDPSGIVHGVAHGVATITYTSLAGCTTTKAITVIAAPSPITGTTHDICQGQTIVLNHPCILGGAWAPLAGDPYLTIVGSPSCTSISYVGSSTFAGTTVVTYTDPSTHCAADYLVTVHENPYPIATQNMCVGETLDMHTLGYPAPGTWTSSTPTILSPAVSTSGLMTGMSVGTTLVTYTTTPWGCATTFHTNVFDCTGGGSMCPGSSRTLVGLPLGGTWSVSPALPAGCVLNPTTGDIYVPTGTTGGVFTFTYTVGTITTTTTITITASATAILNGTTIPAYGFDITSTCVSTSPSCPTIYYFRVYDFLGNLLGSPIPYSTSMTFLDYTAYLTTLPVTTGYPSTATAYTICLVGMECNCCYNALDACAHVNIISPKSSPSVAGSFGPIEIIPNPNTGTFSIQGGVAPDSKLKNVSVEIVDMLGKVIHQETVSIENGAINANISLGGDIPNGMYLVRIKNEEINQVVKFTLSR